MPAMLSFSKRIFQSGYFPQLRLFSSSSVLPPFKERKVKVLDAEINLIETVENVENAPAIFYLPGVFGSIEMDFKPIMHEFNREKYKWICWDPPGFGKSVPPRREFCSKNYECVYLLDVKYIKEIMNIMGHKKYTLLAWSGAGISAIAVAAEEPQRVSSMITWAAFGFCLDKLVPRFKVMRQNGLDAIPEPRKSQLLNMYGPEYLLEMWHGWCDEAIGMVYSKGFKEGGAFQQVINSVKVPTLVIHGLKDALIPYSMAQHLHDSIKNSRLQDVKTGTHNLHLRETKEFVNYIQQFVDEQQKP